MPKDAPPGLRIADFGAGVGTAGLALAVSEPGVLVTLIERDPALADFARENAEANAPGRADVIEADVTDARALRAEGLPPDAADIVMMNPPFFEEGTVRASPFEQRRVSHVMEGEGLEGWMAAARRALGPKGSLALIHRADALGAILSAMAKGFGGLRILPVQAREGEPAQRVLVSARLGSRAPLALLPPLVLHDAAGKFTPLADAIHRRLAAF
jgi:tRNA1(Val) A37 N6-methylase TrmN6